MPPTRRIVLAAATTAFVFAGACASSNSAAVHDEEKCGEVKPGTITSVNSMCAVMPQDPVDPALATAEWRGQKVGFCCKGCVPRWNKMSAAEKDAALAAAMKSR